jgi:3-dehydroquinate synthase
VKLTVNAGEHTYPILIDERAHYGALLPFVSGEKVVVITNDVVGPLYVGALATALEDKDVEIIVVPDGEHYKTLDQANEIYSQLLAFGANRSTTLVALGGGVIGDLTGFVAATFMRGVPFIQVPTSLLAQVDASVGGKTAVNHAQGKNLIGSFYQPKAVYIGVDSLRTLPAREYASGLAEVIKYGLIMDADFFALLEDKTDALQAQDPAMLVNVIAQCCGLKAEVVAEDEKEHGRRAILNLGHTYGHAIETLSDYDVLHGEAVAIGMMLALERSEKEYGLDASVRTRTGAWLMAMGLPIQLPEGLTLEHMQPVMQKDKKANDDGIRFVLLKALGCATI